MFALVGVALFYSTSGQAPVEQWIALLMIIVILIQLIEISLPFRALEVTILPFAAPFATEPFAYIFDVQNPKEVATEPLFFRLSTSADWTAVPSIEPHGRVRVHLIAPGVSAGPHALPLIRVKSRARSELFQLWRRLAVEDSFFALPAAADHGVGLPRSAPEVGSSELSHLELIKDERLMFKLDQKIFLKTGQRYYRVTEEIRNDERISLSWSQLSGLGSQQREEQFSSWLKELRRLGTQTSIHASIETPFFNFNASLKSLDWLALHEAYAEWLYAQV